jgi:hypothetical protein
VPRLRCKAVISGSARAGAGTSNGTLTQDPTSNASACSTPPPMPKVQVTVQGSIPRIFGLFCPKATEFTAPRHSATKVAREAMKKAGLAILLLAGCATVKVPLPVGGSRAHGIIETAYEYGAFDKVKSVDMILGHEGAAQRCRAWGYSDAEPFGDEARTCIASTQYGCARWRVVIPWQCTTPNAPLAQAGCPPSSDALRRVRDEPVWGPGSSRHGAAAPHAGLATQTGGGPSVTTNSCPTDGTVEALAGFAGRLSLWRSPWTLFTESELYQSWGELLLVAVFLALCLFWMLMERKTALRFWLGVAAVVAGVNLVLNDGPIAHTVTDAALALLPRSPRPFFGAK